MHSLKPTPPRIDLKRPSPPPPPPPPPPRPIAIPKIHVHLESKFGEMWEEAVQMEITVFVYGRRIDFWFILS